MILTTFKKIKTSLTLIVCIGLLLTNCDRGVSIDCENHPSCQENIRSADISLSDSVKAMFPFEMADTLVFKNVLDNEILFKVGHIDKGLFEDLLIANCLHCENDTQFERINYEHFFFSFYPINNQLANSFQINYYVKVFDEKSRSNRLFYEELYIGTFEVDESDEGLLIIPKIHENQGEFPNDFVEKQTQNIFHKEILLHNKSFQSVYTSNENLKTIFYFSFQKGLIGFRKSDELWLYQGTK